MAHVIAIANQKGGVGKTTTAASLASCDALAGARCLLIDMDPQANATSGLGVDPARHGGRIHPLLRAPRHPPQPAPAPSVDGWVSKCAGTGLEVLAGTPGLQEVERQIAALPDGHQRLAQLVEGLGRQYDHVILDCPPSLGLLTVNALYASDTVMVPIQCEYFAMEGVSRVLDLVGRVGKTRGRPVRLAGFILTMFDAAQALCREVHDEVRRYFKESVFKAVIPRDVALAEAPSHGVSIVEYAPRSRGAHAYIELTREALGHGTETIREGAGRPVGAV